MRKTPSTKKALMMSVLSLFLCVVMLAGTTYAWFTDSVTSSANKIVAGTLKIDLELYDAKNAEWNSIKTSKAPIFNYDKWEPGYTDIKVLKVENEGTLALKWKARFVSSEAVGILADVIDVYVLATPAAAEAKVDGKYTYANAPEYPDSRDLEGEGFVKVGTLAEFINTIDTTTTGILEEGQTAYLAIALVMQTSAGNEYQGQSIGGAFDIQIAATQVDVEADSFGPDYDAEAPFEGSTVVPMPEAGANPGSIAIYNSYDEKIGTVEIPAAALSDSAANIAVNIAPSNYTIPNFTIDPATQDALKLDINVAGLKEDNTTEVTVEIYIGMNLEPSLVSVYHYENLIDSEYNPYSGYVTFKTATFSPFTVVYNTVEKYNPSTANPEDAPVAYVEKVNTVYNGTFDAYEQWAPNPDIANPSIEVEYIFSCIGEGMTKMDAINAAKENGYAYWECDFFLSVDRAVGENDIFLAGNYGDYGWIGTHNYNKTYAAGEELALLGSVTNTPWTVLDVLDQVTTFTCGAGAVDADLAGATITVQLRITNPEKRSEVMTLATVTYTFAE